MKLVSRGDAANTVYDAACSIIGAANTVKNVSYIFNQDEINELKSIAKRLEALANSMSQATLDERSDKLYGGKL